MNPENFYPDEWTEEQRNFFSRIFRYMESNQPLFCHPLAKPIDLEHWATTCWNAAYFATHCTKSDAPFIISMSEAGYVMGAEVTPDRMN